MPSFACVFLCSYLCVPKVLFSAPLLLLFLFVFMNFHGVIYFIQLWLIKTDLVFLKVASVLALG